MLDEIEPQVKNETDLAMFQSLNPTVSYETLILAKVVQNGMKQQWRTQKFLYEDDVVTPLSYFMSCVLGFIIFFILLEFMVLYCINVAFSGDPDDVNVFDEEVKFKKE